jgi:hypothetical protein
LRNRKEKKFLKQNINYSSLLYAHTHKHTNRK